VPAPELLHHCTELVSTLNASEDWRLTAPQRERYAEALAALVDPDVSPELLQQVALNYHRDHRLVAALRNPQHPDHALRWLRWMQSVRSILHQRGLYWATDAAVDDDDLTQIAMIALQGALPTYQYRSRFSAWAYSVVVRRIKRYNRDSRRLRRKALLLSLDQITTHDPDRAPPADDRTEDETHTQALYAQIERVLAAQPDRRLRTIIHLAYVEDCHPADIGARVDLQPARVRALIRQARRIISADPVLHASFYPAGTGRSGSSPEQAYA
jgi:RNA polymerase sigma factor (sigma-70 family)